MAGLAIMISYFKLVSFICVTGIILLENKKAMPAKKIVNINSGRIKRISGIPAALMAISSKLSPKFPKVMMEENNKAKGSAVVKVLTETNPTNSKMVNRSNPLPTKSSMYNQKNCMVSTKVEIVSAAKNGPMKALRISMSNFLNKMLVLTTYTMKELFNLVFPKSALVLDFVFLSKIFHD